MSFGTCGGIQRLLEALLVVALRFQSSACSVTCLGSFVIGDMVPILRAVVFMCS